MDGTVVKIRDYRQALEYLEEVRPHGMVLGLDRMKLLMEKMGNPQESLSFVHIAGTNGKGSVLSFVSEILKCAGYRTGRYSSPTVFSDLEKIQVNGRSITKAYFTEGLEVVRCAAESMKQEKNLYPTLFEIETALAFWYFSERKCDIVVLEAGLGGRDDATNLIRTTKAAVFTSLSLDHTGILGDSLEEIARQKAGIIKENCTAVCGLQEESAEKVLVEACKNAGVSMRKVSRNNISKIKFGLEKQLFSYCTTENVFYDKLEISMAGSWQIENAALAVEVIAALGNRGFPVSEKKLREGLQRAVWKGRFSVIAKKPYFIIDGAHNEGAAEKLAQTVSFYFTNRKIITIMGVLKDKDYDKIAELTAGFASQIITVAAPGNPRALSSYELANTVKRYNPNVTAADSLEEAAEMSYLLAGRDDVILAFGSLSYLGRLAKIVKNRDKIRRDTHGKSGKN